MFIKCIRKLTNAPPLVSASDGVADVLLVMLILAAGLSLCSPSAWAAGSSLC